MESAISSQEHWLVCQSCRSRHDPRSALWACPCGGILDVEMAPSFPWAAMSRRAPGLWRYLEALPLQSRRAPVSLGEMQTPLIAAAAAGAHLYLKLDHLLPTGSFKDRGAAVLLSRAAELGIGSVVEDSSGNAGAAIAAYAARAAIRATIFVPATAPAAKTAAIQLYGARLVRVPGSRSDTTQAAWKEAEHTYYASHVWNPYFLEGTKTIALEIWEQLGRRVPDWVISPVGHGTLLLGLYKGFSLLKEAGITAGLPRIVGVQAAACAPLVAAFQRDSAGLADLAPAPTQADGIAIAHPPRWRQILGAISASEGTMIGVTEPDIRRSLLHWAGRGLLMEPTSATATAAFSLLADQGWFGADQLVVVPITGNGVKTATAYAPAEAGAPPAGQH